MLNGYRVFEKVQLCPLCERSEFATVDSEASVLRCVHCSFRFVSPRPTQAEVARGYSLPSSYEAWKSEGSAREQLWRRRYRQVLGTRQKGRLLDVGAGLGTFLAIARMEGWDVAGTEISETAIANAQANYGIELVRGALREDVVEGQVDVITMWHVLEHVPDPIATLQICRSLLCAGGVLVMGLPNDATPANAVSVIVRACRRFVRREVRPRYNVLRPGVESHLSHFTPRTVRRALVEARLEVVHIGVDDALPTRTPFGHVVFALRRLLTTLTPWNFATEMLVIARRSELRASR